MKKTLIGAASLTALMAVGLAACGQNDTTYAENENDPYAETGDAARTTDSQMSDVEPADAADARRQAQDYAADQDAAETEESDSFDVAQDEAATDDASAAGSGAMTLASFTSVRTREEVQNVAEDVFAEADLNGDGVLDRAEYLSLALADTGMSDGMEGEGDWSNPTDETASVGGAEPDSETSAPTQLASVDEQQNAEAMFDDASEDGESLTLEEMREAFLARFDEADENGDQQLDTLERMKFAQLVAGEETSNGSGTDRQ